MKQRTYTTEGIILFRKNYHEADRILVIYSKHYGKLTLLVKGIRKIKSKKRGHLEIFSQIKFSAVKNKGMDIMTETETISDFYKIRANLNKISLAYYFCEVVNKITREDEQITSIYNLLLITLKQLEKEEKLKTLRLEFVFNLLTKMGYWPIDKKLVDADNALSDVLERTLDSVRVGKRILE